MAVVETGSQKAAAHALGVHIRTIKNHLTPVLREYGADSCAQALWRASADLYREEPTWTAS